MRTKLLLIPLLLITGVVWGQEDNIKIGNQFILRASAKHSTTDVNQSTIYNETSETANYLDDGIKYKIVDIEGDNIIVKVYPLFKKPGKKFKGVSKATYYNNKLFSITKAEYLAKAEKFVKEDVPDRLSIGILTLPFKFRPQDEKTFEAQFNLNSTLNILLGVPRPSHNYFIQVGAGLGSVELNSNNSLGIGVDENINAATLTMFSGVMLQYKKVQAGIYVGVDHINNQNHYQWKNNGNMWFGFGVGYQLFNVGLGEDRKKTQEQNK
ncbi:hypothetical protein NU10_04185 [Flavobacterium dauae]|uniref:hypothetical protein n=1 Tax=Flavobacterium dauae TaxID=1563479 RepID=UPI00101B3F39|nr:hypothetical protein [Flavobacterium dauae]WLD24604.1 hypothetical protein NU10_04185 [Flavobacterium dauae]